MRALLLSALDRPALASVELAGRPLWLTVTLGFVGLAGVALASLASSAVVMGDDLALLLQGHGLRGLLEALLIVVPSSVLLSGYLRVQLNTRALLGAVATGLYAAGLVALCMVPLVVFLVLIDAGSALPSALIELLFPALALAVTASFVARAVRAIDAGARARALVTVFAFTLCAVFLLRVEPLLGALAAGTTP